MEITIKGKETKAKVVPAELIYTYVEKNSFRTISQTEYYTDGSINVTAYDAAGLKLFRMYKTINGKIERVA